MSVRTQIAVAAALLVPVVAVAQSDCDGDGFPNVITPIFTEDFEAGFPAGWFADGLWNTTADCQSSFGPATTGTQHAYFGIAAQCDYNDSGALDGEIQTSTFSVPDDTQTLVLEFDSRLITERGTRPFFEDAEFVLVNVDQGLFVTVDANRFASDDWTFHAAAFDVSTFHAPGDQYYLLCRFDPRDTFLNDSLGWQLDNLSMSASNFIDANANGLSDVCDVSDIISILDFEEGDASDLDNQPNVPAGSGNIGLGGPGGLLFNVSDQCLTTSPADECGTGDFVMQFSDPSTCNYATGSARNSGIFTFEFNVASGFAEEITLRFCSKYVGERGSFNGQWGIVQVGNDFFGEWLGANFDRAGVAVYESFEGNAPDFSSPIAVLDVSSASTDVTEGVWQRLELPLQNLQSGTYTVAFGFDSVDELNNLTLGWQVDNIVVERTPTDLVGNSIDINENGVPDDAESFLVRLTQPRVFLSSLQQGINSLSGLTNTALAATPRSLEMLNVDLNDTDVFTADNNNLTGIDPTSQSSITGNLIIPTSSRFVLSEDGPFPDTTINGTSVRGGLTLLPGVETVFDSSVAVNNFGVLEILPGAVFDTPTTTFVPNGTVRYYDANATSPFNVGGFSSRNGLDDSLFEVFGSVGVDLQINPTGRMDVLADTQLTERFDLRGEAVVLNGVLSILGEFVGSGTITGQAVTPVPGRVAQNGGRVSGQGVFFASDATLAQSAAFYADSPGFVLSAGGNLNVEINDNSRFELAQAELRLNALGLQAFEALSRDRGPVFDGLDPSLDGSFPIGTLRVGPVRTIATLVDTNDNDAGDANAEVIYATNVIVEPGATLNLTDHVVYYENAQVLGTVINPGNLIEIEPMLPCPTDLTGDGTTDISDLLQLLAVFNTASASGDITGDGQSDISDLLQLLTQFNTACP